MGILIKWKAIDDEATYTHARVYRATSEEGEYTLVKTQVISDQSYYDASGTTSSWYKIDFYNSSTGAASALSDAMQGGTYKGYCLPDDVRKITNLTTSDITDSQLFEVIEFGASELNADISVHHEEEVVGYINNTKSNDINGSNTTFYTKEYPIGDKDDDMGVDTNDILVYQYAGDADSTRTELTVSTITPNTGQFVLSSAPAATIEKLTLVYRSVQRSVSDPDPLVKLAAVQLAASWAFTRINVGKAPRWKMGNTSIWRDTSAGKNFYKQYLSTVSKINDRKLTEMEEAINLL